MPLGAKTMLLHRNGTRPYLPTGTDARGDLDIQSGKLTEQRGFKAMTVARW